jgi:hypothetical protein
MNPLTFCLVLFAAAAASAFPSTTSSGKNVIAAGASYESFNLQESQPGAILTGLPKDGWLQDLLVKVNDFRQANNAAPLCINSYVLSLVTCMVCPIDA